MSKTITAVVLNAVLLAFSSSLDAQQAKKVPWIAFLEAVLYRADRVIR